MTGARGAGVVPCKSKKGQATGSWIAQFRPGDVVADYDKEPDPNTNRGTVEKILDVQLVRVLWKGGTTSDRPAFNWGR